MNVEVRKLEGDRFGVNLDLPVSNSDPDGLWFEGNREEMVALVDALIEVLRGNELSEVHSVPNPTTEEGAFLRHAYYSLLAKGPVWIDEKTWNMPTPEKWSIQVLTNSVEGPQEDSKLANGVLVRAVVK